MHIYLSGTILNGSFLQNIGDAEHIISSLMYADFKEVCIPLTHSEIFFSWAQIRQRGVSQDCRLVV